MRINLKALGLALVAALAMSAVAASAAQATGQFEADEYPAIAKGEHKGEENFLSITASTGTPEFTKCENATYQATLSDVSNSLTVLPHYSGCEGKTIHLNGCHFEFKTTGTSGGATTGTADVVCPDETTIEVTGPFGVCQIHIEPDTNKNLTGITFTNVANGDVTVDVNIREQINYIETDTAFCPYGSEPLTQEDGSFVSSVLIEGFDDEGQEPHPTTSNANHPPITYKTGADTDINVG